MTSPPLPRPRAATIITTTDRALTDLVSADLVNTDLVGADRATAGPTLERDLVRDGADDDVVRGRGRRRDVDGPANRATDAQTGRPAEGGSGAADASGAAAAAVVASVYAEYGPMLQRYCMRLLGDPQMAQDAVQEVMLRVWRHPEALAASRGPARPWLLTVARNVVVDSARARRVRPTEVPFEPGMTVPGEAITDDEIDRVVESWQIAEGLRQLSAPHRDVLVQMFYLDRTVNETARVLGIPPGTVKSRAYYALRALRAALRESGVMP